MNELKPYPFESILLEPPNKLAAIIEKTILTARAAIQRKEAAIEKSAEAHTIPEGLGRVY